MTVFALIAVVLVMVVLIVVASIAEIDWFAAVLTCAGLLFIGLLMASFHTQEDSWTDARPIVEAAALSEGGGKFLVEYADGASGVVEGAEVVRDGKMVEVVEHHRSQKTCLLGPVSEPDEWSEVELHVQADPADGSKGGAANEA